MGKAAGSLRDEEKLHEVSEKAMRLLTKVSYHSTAFCLLLSLLDESSVLHYPPKLVFRPKKSPEQRISNDFISRRKFSDCFDSICSGEIHEINLVVGFN
jgi:hypothetical protein